MKRMGRLQSFSIVCLTAGILGAGLAFLLSLVPGCQKPIPYTPQQIQDWSGGDVTDYPASSVANRHGRDAGGTGDR